MVRAKGTERVLDILDAMEVLSAPISRNALAKVVGCPRSTLYALVEQLLERGWLIQLEDGNVCLGYRAGLVGTAYGRQSTFDMVARNIVKRVATQLSAVCEINVIEGWQQLVLISETGSSRNYLRTIEGARYPLPMTGSSRLQLVGIPQKVLKTNIPDDHFKLRVDKSLTWNDFLAEIDQADSDGFFTARGLVDPYIATLGCPIADGNGECLATLSIIMPEAELDERFDEAVSATQAGALELTQFVSAVGWPMGERARRALQQ